MSRTGLCLVGKIFFAERFHDVFAHEQQQPQASSYNCIDKVWAQSTGDKYRKVGLEWQNGNNTEIIGISQTGNVFQYNSELSPAPSRAVSLPDPEWDIICNNGGMKRWESSKGGIMGLHPEKINQVFGNAECKCNEGWVRSSIESLC